MARKRLGDYKQEDFDNYVNEGWRSGWLGRQTWLSLIVKIVLALILVSLIGSAVGFASGWFDQGKRIVSPENVRKTWSEAYKLDRGLQAQARIVCRTAQSSGLADTVSGSTLLATQTTYDKMQARYSELVSNKLEGGLVLPPDLSSKDKTLTERLKESDVDCPDKVIEQISGGLK